MASGWSLIIGLIIIVIASVVAWIFSPKGDNQTYISLPPTSPPALVHYVGSGH
ncbi:hypothetical protein BDV23DRAFT_160887 [Aspergillus alliaceus]|uniref:Uncharacterized protein n=1 Tax=Petromyces alliaceus TaxID=209559 RepID=A0A5N7C0L1_PETAA|nr:hypothetical protein BDV23DRAFT_160887 [Aspergillus alliaceus]